MPKYYCDYCDTFLTHDSPSVRKTHNGGRKHKENVRMYYQSWMEAQAQKLVDATARVFAQQQRMAQGAAGAQPVAPPMGSIPMPRAPQLPASMQGLVRPPMPYAAYGLPIPQPGLVRPGSLPLPGLLQRIPVPQQPPRPQMSSGRLELRNIFEMNCIDIRRDALDYITEFTKSYTSAERKKYAGTLIEKINAYNVSVGSVDLKLMKEILLSLASNVRTNGGQIFKIVNLPTDNYYVLNETDNRYDLKPRSEKEPAKPYSFMRSRLQVILNSLDTSLPHQDNIRLIEGILAEEDCNATILALIRSNSNGGLDAEDLTGTITLDFSMHTPDGWLPFEGGIFLFVGQRKNGVFFVTNIRLPEPRARENLPKLAINDVMNRRSYQKCYDTERVVVLSNVHLDLHGFFRRDPPAIIVFCGDFLSVTLDVGYIEELTNRFRDFVRVFAAFREAYEETHFVFVPGMSDPPRSPFLPRPPLLPCIQDCFIPRRSTQPYPNVHFATNPCILLYKDRSILVKRDDTMDKMSRCAALITDKKVNMRELYFKTIWSQRHLSPFMMPMSPVIPAYDDALIMHSEPDIAVLADSHRPFEWGPEDYGPLTVNPCSLAHKNEHATVIMLQNGDVKRADFRSEYGDYLSEQSLIVGFTMSVDLIRTGSTDTLFSPSASALNSEYIELSPSPNANGVSKQPPQPPLNRSSDREHGFDDTTQIFPEENNRPVNGIKYNGALSSPSYNCRSTDSSNVNQCPIALFIPCANSHPFEERRIMVPPGEINGVKIGRAVARSQPLMNNAIFECKVLSRNHAVLWYDEGTFYIRDTRSSNGSFVNNQRLSNSGEESLPRVLNSGDILQLGVEIVDNAKNVASGCISCIVHLYDVNGQECVPERRPTLSSSISDRIPNDHALISQEKLFQLNLYVKEARFREKTLTEKIRSVEAIQAKTKEEAEAGWQALINEERLLSRIEVLQNELESIKAKATAEGNRVQESRQQEEEDRVKAELIAKEALRKANEQAYESQMKAHDMENSLGSLETENAFLKQRCADLELELQRRSQDINRLNAENVARAADEKILAAKLNFDMTIPSPASSAPMNASEPAISEDSEAEPPAPMKFFTEADTQTETKAEELPTTSTANGSAPKLEPSQPTNPGPTASERTEFLFASVFPFILLFLLIVYPVRHGFDRLRAVVTRPAAVSAAEEVAEGDKKKE